MIYLQPVPETGIKSVRIQFVDNVEIGGFFVGVTNEPIHDANLGYLGSVEIPGSWAFWAHYGDKVHKGKYESYGKPIKAGSILTIMMDKRINLIN